jgi:HK97 family phage prohead protease
METFEVRSNQDAAVCLAGRKISGYAARYNCFSLPMPDGNGGTFRERIVPGAFDGVLSSDIRCLYAHDPEKPLGRTTAGTLHVKSDSLGLWFRCSLPAVYYADAVATLIHRGDIAGCSFAFSVATGGDSWRRDASGLIREIKKIGRLVEISVLTNPAYPDTSVAVRGLTEWMKTAGGVAAPNVAAPRSNNWRMSLDREKQRLVNLSIRL